MTAHRARLTEMDIRRLVKPGDDDDRADAAYKLCRNLDRADLTHQERDAAQKIIRLLAQDAAEMVRRAMTVTLKASDLIPVDVARRLAADLDSIALPILNASPVLGDEDLIEIVRAGDAARQVAVASRARVSRDVASAVADVGTKEAVRTLAANDNADISEGALSRIVDRFAADEDVTTALAYRQVLPLSITERLLVLASDAVRDHLISRHAIAPETAIQLTRFAGERATVDLIEQASLSVDMAAFMRQLNSRKALTASLLLRALARGHMAVLEYGLAELATTPHQRAWLMVHDAGPLGLKAIYDRAGLPPRLFQAFRAGVDTWRSLSLEGADLSREVFRERMLERFLTQRPNVLREDLAYLLERLDQLPVRDNASQDRASNAA